MKVYATAVNENSQILTTSYDNRAQAERYRGKDNPLYKEGELWLSQGKIVKENHSEYGRLIRSIMENDNSLFNDFKFVFYQYDYELEKWVSIPNMGAMTYGTANAIMKECLINIYSKVMVVEFIEE